MWSSDYVNNGLEAVQNVCVEGDLPMPQLHTAAKGSGILMLWNSNIYVDVNNMILWHMQKFLEADTLHNFFKICILF